MSVISALIGSSTVIRHVQHLVLKVAESDAPVLITGEPGTGKEHVASVIHEKSPRASGPFVPVKCGSMSDELLEAELFGHEKGAFAGAHQARQGRFELAAGGTIFLEEVNRLSLALQAALLKALQEGVVQPVGAAAPVPVNVRIICSTSVNIDNCVRERQFREDLYYRLASCAVYVPPLRERREDIASLVDHFITRFNANKGKHILGVSPDAMSALLQNPWNHNIQELENLIERIVVLKNTGSIEVCDLPPRLRQLVTDNIDAFYEREGQQSSLRAPSAAPASPANGAPRPGSHLRDSHAPASPTLSSFRGSNGGAQFPNQGSSPKGSSSNQMQPGFGAGNPGFGMGGGSFDDNSEIDQFIKKEIDLGSGIDFYRVVEEFENRLIAEALRRTNHNKNRAAQLLSMNRTTLVEKLKKRAASSSVKVDTGRVKRNPAFTIFDGLGTEARDFEGLDFLQARKTGGGGVEDID